MKNENGEKADYELYTEKVVLNPKRKYKKLFRFLKRLAIICVSLAILVVLVAFAVSKIISEIQKSKSEVIYIEKDNYDDYEDDQYSEDNQNLEDTEDPKEDLSENVDTCMKSVLVIDSKNTDNVAGASDEGIDKLPGVLIGRVNSEYMLLTSSKVENLGLAGQLIVKFSDTTEANLSIVSTFSELGISICKFNASDISKDIKDSIKVANLGNSYLAKQGDAFIVIGKLSGVTTSVDYCKIDSSKVNYGVDRAEQVLKTDYSKATNDFAFLFDSEGSLIGVSYQTDDPNLLVRGISDLKAIIESMINKHGIMYFGITGQNVTDEMTSKYGLPTGIYVSNVELNSPAYMAGIQAGDIIQTVDKRSVLTIQDFSEKLYQKTDGENMEITVKRMGKEGYGYQTFDVVVKLKIK